MPYDVKSMNESLCEKPPRRFGIHSSSLTRAIHKFKEEVIKTNRFSNGANRFGGGRGNSFGNKGGETSRQRRGCYNCGEEGHFIGEFLKPKEDKAFLEGAWSDSEDSNELQNDATCLMAIESQERSRKKHSKLFSKVNELEFEVKKLDKSKEVVEPCKMWDVLTKEVDTLKCLQDEALNFSKFKKSSVVLDDMLSRQKLSQDKEGLVFSKNNKTAS
nr:hypothetical protein [Tanacetum cinerariifolium]